MSRRGEPAESRTTTLSETRRAPRVCVPPEGAVGGGTLSFYRNLRAYLAAAGIPFTDRPEDDYDALVVNSWVTPYRAVLRAKRTHPRLKVLHRVDGSALDYGREALADLKQALVNRLADVTVFQSHYAKYATTRKYRVIRRDGPVIHNPVDVERFRPDGERVSLPGRGVRVGHVTHSTNPRKGGAVLSALAAATPHATFILIGRYEAVPPLPNVHFLGYADRETLPALLKSCDVFLMLAENEACPNVVLEAMASGLPILYRASGATEELVGECGRPIDQATFGEALAWAANRRAALGETARRRAIECFSPTVVFPRYVEALATARPGPAPTVWEPVRVVARSPQLLLALVRWGVGRAVTSARALAPAPAR